MIKGKCIYCNEVKDLNEEHAFPESLRQKGVSKWVIRKHLCTDCNSQLGELDAVLSKRSPLAYIRERIQDGLGYADKTLHSSIYHKKARGINPVRLFLPNPVYDGHIILHEFKVESNNANVSVDSVVALQPQIILTQYAEGQTGEGIIAENLEKFNTISSDEDFITDYDEQQDVYFIFGNTYVFPPKVSERFFNRAEDFKSIYMKDSPEVRYDLRVIYPEESRYQGVVNTFYDSFKGEIKEIIEPKKFQNPDVFTQSIQAVSDPKSIPEFLRAIAKTAFHCFLYHYPEFSGHEPVFAEIRDFIYTGTPNKFVAQCRNTETADLVYDSTEHLHVFYFFIQGDDIGCRIDFFTGLLPNQFSYEITLAGNPENSHPSCNGVAFIPFSVHPESQMKRRIYPVTELGIVQKPRWGDGGLWLPGSTRRNDAVFYNNRGETYLSEGKIDEAINDFNTVIMLQPKLAAAYNKRGIAYKEKRELDHAIEDFNKAIELKPDYAIAYSNRGAVYCDKGEHDQAIADCNKAIELKPDYASAYNNRGKVYLFKGEVDEAINDYNKAIEVKSDFAEAYNNRGAAYSKKGEVDQAINDYNKAVRLNPAFADAYCNRGNAYLLTGDVDKAIEDYSLSIKYAPKDAMSYSNRGVAYLRKGEVNKTIEDTSKAIELNEKLSNAYYNRAEARLRLKEWDKAKSDLTTAQKLGMDIVAAFHNNYKNVETYARWQRVRLPEDIAHMLTQPLRVRFPKQQKILSPDGTPLESPSVVNLREQLRNTGTPLGTYLKVKPSFGIKTSPTEAFVVDKKTRDNLIAAHPSSADILKPFLHGRDLKRWHAEPQEKWLIFAHRGIAINEYPAILKHLENHKDALHKRSGKQEWYELPISLDKSHRFSQPKLVCPNLYNHQTFAVDTAGFYCGDTCYLIPTEELWLCGLLNSRVVEWFYSQVSNQLTIDYLRARSGYMQQIPIPDLTSTQQALIGKFVDYLIYLQQQPTTNSSDLAYARDAVMLGYFERIIEGMVYESYLPDELHKSRKHLFQPLSDEQLPQLEEIQGDKMSACRDIFERLYEKTHPVAVNLFFLDSVKPVRIIEGKL